MAAGGRGQSKGVRWADGFTPKGSLTLARACKETTRAGAGARWSGVFGHYAFGHQSPDVF